MARALTQVLSCRVSGGLSDRLSRDLSGRLSKCLSGGLSRELSGETSLPLSLTRRSKQWREQPAAEACQRLSAKRRPQDAGSRSPDRRRRSAPTGSPLAARPIERLLYRLL